MDWRVKNIAVLLITVALAIANFCIFGLVHYRTWSDAQEYNAYAMHLAEGGVYSFDGVHFDVGREPGYPFFLAIVYKVFGSGNLLAACFIQALILGLLGYIIYRLFAEHQEEKAGVCAGIFVSIFPSYGYYANEILTELLFAFLLGVIFFIVHRIFFKQAAWQWYAVLGFLCGYATLTRIQFMFFLPLLCVLFLVFQRKEWKRTLGQALIALVVFALIVGSWGMYVRSQTGHFALTEGRQELVLNVRATRANLSYAQLSQYAVEWVKRSVSGGAHYALLDSNEAKGITLKYLARATTTEEVSRIKEENIRIIFSHPGQYLFGNLIEVMKMAYIEHDYTDSQSRYFRPVLYALMYLFFLFGLYQVARNWRRSSLTNLALLALVFPGYNLFVLSFFDTVPRFNTPYLMFYLVIGCIGVALLKSKGRDPRDAD